MAPRGGHPGLRNVVHGPRTVGSVGAVAGFEGVDPSLYEDPATVAAYGPGGGLQPPEAAILRRIEPEVRGGRVLDIGVGSGRTVGPLRALASEYVGIDYSDAMLAVGRRVHPGVDLRLGDVRDLADFESGSFRLVVFSFNGIDSISHEDRFVALREIRRVVEDGGLFVFSTHNEAYRPTFRKLWFDGLDIGHDPLRSPIRLLRAVPRLARRLRNHLGHRGQQTKADGYSIVCDGGFDHTALCYTIGREAQVDQLTATGFATEAVYDLAGEEAAPGCTDQWLTYVARAVGPGRAPMVG